jgi:hypothetical protein
MTATVSLEISDYLPSGFNYEGFSFSFRTDNFEEAIDVRKNKYYKPNLYCFFKINFSKKQNFIYNIFVLLQRYFFILLKTQKIKNLPSFNFIYFYIQIYFFLLLV